MSCKKWVKFVTIISISFIILLASFNFIVDPFKIFNTNILKEDFQINERFVKIEYLEKNHNKYNSYMFGSSRIGTTEPNVIEKYIPNSKFYNFTLSSANLYDYLIHLKYFIKEQYTINNLYLQLDLNLMYNYGISPSDYLRKPHPYVTNDSMLSYYFQYLFGYFPFNIKGKIFTNIYHNPNKTIYSEKGFWSKPYLEKRINLDHKKYIQNESTFNKKYSPIYKSTQNRNNYNSLKEIVKLCKSNNINLILFTTPHNKHMMDTFTPNGYKEFLKLTSTITSFYDFSGYNTITKDDAYYYEYSHYRPILAKLIAAKIFNDKSIKVPNDFGILIKKSN